MQDQPPRAATWRIILAAALDFFTAFAIFGYLVAWASGGLTAGGFELEGIPALIVFALIVAYFLIGKKLLGGTPWQRFLNAY